MRKSYKAMAAVSLAAWASSASAALLIYEPFSPNGTTPLNYQPGEAITGQQNTTSAQPETWLRAGTVGTTVHQIGTGSLTAGSQPQPSIGNSADLKLADVGELERLNIPNAFVGTTAVPVYGANTTLYYSLLLNVPTLTGLTVAHTNVTAANDLIASLNNVQGSQATRPTLFAGELVIRTGSVANTFNLGVKGSQTTAGTTAFTSADLTPGQTYFVVVEYAQGGTPGSAGNGFNSIWINPAASSYGVAEGSKPAADGGVAGSLSMNSATDNIESMLIGAGIAAGAAPNDVNIDEIRLGETWADVTPVPEPASIGLLSLGGLALARRRRGCVS